MKTYVAVSSMAAGRCPTTMLMIHSLVLGSGRRLLIEGSPFATLRLVKSVTTTTSVVIANYESAPDDAA